MAINLLETEALFDAQILEQDSSTEGEFEPAATTEELLQEVSDFLKKSNLENSLAQAVEKSKKSNLLTAQEEIELKGKIDQGDEVALEQFVKANQGLIVFIAKPYFGLGLETEDLIQEGNLGLLRAIKDFDYKKGYKFSTYGYFWIRSAILRALYNKGRLIRVPLWAEQALGKMDKAASIFEQKEGRTPTLQELSKEVKVPARSLEAIVADTKLPISMETQVNPRNEVSFWTLHDIIADPRVDVEKEIGLGSLKGVLLEVLEEELTDRMKQILKMRFGLDNGQEMTFEEIGKELGITTAGANDIFNRAMGKLRNTPYAEVLRKEYYSEPVVAGKKNTKRIYSRSAKIV